MTRHITGPTLEVGRTPDRVQYLNMPLDGDVDYLHFLDDFDQVALDLTNRWTEVKDVGASSAIQADTIGGRVVLTSTAATDNDGSSLQGNEIFRPKAGRSIWLQALIRLSDVVNMDFFLGLSTNFVTNPEALLTSPDRIGFQKDDGSALLLAKTEAGGTETSTSTAISAVNATDIKLALRVLGIGLVEFYVDGVFKASHTANIPDTQELALAFMSLSGDAVGTKTLEVDYVKAVMTR